MSCTKTKFLPPLEGECGLLSLLSSSDGNDDRTKSRHPVGESFATRECEGDAGEHFFSPFMDEAIIYFGFYENFQLNKNTFYCTDVKYNFAFLFFVNEKQTKLRVYSSPFTDIFGCFSSHIMSEQIYPGQVFVIAKKMENHYSLTIFDSVISDDNNEKCYAYFPEDKKFISVESTSKPFPFLFHEKRNLIRMNYIYCISDCGRYIEVYDEKLSALIFRFGKFEKEISKFQFERFAYYDYDYDKPIDNLFLYVPEIKKYYCSFEERNFQKDKARKIKIVMEYRRLQKRLTFSFEKNEYVKFIIKNILLKKL